MPKRSRLRRVFYSPQVADDLARLRASDEDVDAIQARVLALADNPDLADLMMVQSAFLSDSQKLYRFEVGRFQLNCRFDFDSSELEVASVSI